MKSRRLLIIMLAFVLAALPVMSFAAQNETESNMQTEASEELTDVAADEPVDDPEPVSPDHLLQDEAVDEGYDQEFQEQAETDLLEAQSNAKVLRSNATDNAEGDSWTPEDFEYRYKSKLMYGCDYTRQLYVNGQVITGFSEQGLAKLDPVINTTTTIDEEGNEKTTQVVTEVKGNSDLVIPSRTPEGETVVGIDNGAFKGMRLTSVRFPTGMLVPYDDEITHAVTRRGNFIIHESAFADNDLTEVYLPAGVLGCMANSFQRNRIKTVTLPKTVWWIETLAFANNEISKVSFPQSCDFRLEMHGMTFADNNIKSVRLPDYTEVVNKDVFAMNPGMEPMTEEIAKKRSATDWQKYMEGGEAESGIVYMYTDREALFDAQRIHTLDRPTKNQWSPFQKLVLISDESPDADTEKWNTSDFIYNGTTINGLSESGKEKRKTYNRLDIPDRTPTGAFVSDIASSGNSTGGLFGAGIRDENGELIGVEGFDIVTLPSGLKRVGDRAFAGMGLKEVIFPNQLQTIGMAAFQDNDLTEVILPDTVASIGGGAFASNEKLRSISIPRNKTYRTIEDGTFGCSDGAHWMPDLTSIEIPDTITEIGNNAFAGNNFERIEIPGSVKTIGRFAFSTKNYLQTPTELILHEGLQTIGSRAFRNKKIENVVLPSTLQSLPVNTFEKVDTDWDVGHGVNNPLITRVFVTSEKQYNDRENFPDSSWHKVYLSDPSKWTTEDFEYGEIDMPGEGSAIAIMGFSEHGLAKAAINPKVTLTAVNEDGDAIEAVAPYAFCASQNNGIEGRSLYGTGTKLSELIIPSGSIRFIGANAFSGNDLTFIAFGDSVTNIAKNAFEGNKLVRLSFPASIKELGKGSFMSNSIDSLEFAGNDAVSLAIAANAFSGNRIKSFQAPDNLDVLKDSAFSDNPGVDDEPGVVRIYKVSDAGSSLEYKSNGKSTCQDIRFGEIPPELAPWGPRHFTISGSTITGLSDDGEAKLHADPYIVLPGKSENGTVITTVGQRAFENCCGNKGVVQEGMKPLLKGVEFAPSITTIKLAAFQMCAIEDLVLPDTIKTIEGSAFSSNYGMTSVKFSDNITEIPEGVFSSNITTGGIETIIIPEGVTKIGMNAFRGQHVKNLILPDTLKEIGESAFMNHQIGVLEIPASVTTIGTRAFEVRQEGIERMPEKLILHEGLISIGEQAFGQTSIESVELPESLKVLPANAFVDWAGNGREDGRPIDLRTSNEDQASGTGEYTRIAVDGDGHRVIFDKMVGTGWDYSDFTYSGDGTAITGWSEQGQQKRRAYAEKDVYPAMVMPDKASYDGDTYITEIADNAFALELYSEITGTGEVTLQKFDADSPYGIQRMEFPEKLERIGNCAFEYNNLKAVDLESAEHLTSIGTSAFHGNHLVSLTIPETVTELGDGAFAMNNISFLTLSESVTVIPQGCFSMNIFMYQVEIPETVTEIGEEAFAGARLETLEIPASVTRIGKKAFHLHHLTSLHIPGSVRFIDDSAFEGTFKESTLEHLTIDEGVEYIGKYAFKEALLQEVELPYSLADMGVDPFYSNKGKNGSGVVTLYSKNRYHLDFNEDRYHGKENGVPRHCHEVVYTGKLPVTITLDVNGGLPIDIESVETNDFGVIADPLPIPESSDPDKLVFIGWYTKRDGGEEVITGSSFARETTIYARWSDAPFVVDELSDAADEATSLAEESVEKVFETSSRDEKEQAAETAKADAERAVESADIAEQAAKAALRAAELEDEKGSTEETKAKIAAAELKLQSVQTTRKKAYSALASAQEVLNEIAAEKAEEARIRKMKSVRTVAVNRSTVSAATINSAIKAAGGSKKYVTTIILGSKVKKIKKNAFKGTKVTKIIVKTKKLKKKYVKGSLRSSKVKTISVKVSKKSSLNKKYVKKYKPYFTKKNAGRKAKVVR